MNQSAPPPSQLPANPGNNSFAQNAAKASLAAPLIAIIANATTRSAAFDASTVKLIVPALATLLFFTGFVLAIVALCGIRRHGPGGLLGKGIAGMLINGVFVVIIIVAFFGGRNGPNSKNGHGSQIVPTATNDLRREL